MQHGAETIHCSGQRPLPSSFWALTWSLTLTCSSGADNVDNAKDDNDDHSKDGGSLAETPWHQDESYWPDLPDKRALSFWSVFKKDFHL